MKRRTTRERVAIKAAAELGGGDARSWSLLVADEAGDGARAKASMTAA